jgi:hypothetical protein
VIAPGPALGRSIGTHRHEAHASEMANAAARVVPIHAERLMAT